jgi:hypothetical protein
MTGLEEVLRAPGSRRMWTSRYRLPTTPRQRTSYVRARLRRRDDAGAGLRAPPGHDPADQARSRQVPGLRGPALRQFGDREALYDLTVYETGTLTQIAEHLYQAHGTLLLSDWAAECASPGITGLVPADDLRLSVHLIREAVRVWVTALTAAVPYEGDRTILQRRARNGPSRRPPTSTFCPATGPPVITRRSNWPASSPPTTAPSSRDT